MDILITLTTAGADTGPFNLYSNLDGFLSPFESTVSKIDLEAGYSTSAVPDGTSIIRVQSMNVLCSNYIDLQIQEITTTTTSTSSTTTTSTTTINPEDLDFYLADEYLCVNCNLQITNVLVAFPIGTSVTIDDYYNPITPDGNVYRVRSVTSSGSGPIMLNDASHANACLSICV